MKIIWMVPEIWSATDKMFCHLGLFLPFYPTNDPEIQNFEKLKKRKTKTKTRRYYNFTNVYHKWQWYDLWFLRFGAWQPDFFVILDHFSPFYTPNTKNQNFEKMKKNSRTHHHFTQVYQKSWSYTTLFLRYDVWQYFCPFTPLTTQKIKIFKKWKNILGISSFYTHIPKIMITHCTDRRYGARQTDWQANGPKDEQTDKRKKWQR